MSIPGTVLGVSGSGHNDVMQNANDKMIFNVAPRFKRSCRAVVQATRCATRYTQPMCYVRFQLWLLGVRSVNRSQTLMLCDFNNVYAVVIVSEVWLYASTAVRIENRDWPTLPVVMTSWLMTHDFSRCLVKIVTSTIRMTQRHFHGTWEIGEGVLYEAHSLNQSTWGDFGPKGYENVTNGTQSRFLVGENTAFRRTENKKNQAIFVTVACIMLTLVSVLELPNSNTPNLHQP